jgi:hypothetical protein
VGRGLVSLCVSSIIGQPRVNSTTKCDKSH